MVAKSGEWTLTALQQHKLYIGTGCLLGVRKFTANYMVLAELGRFPLQIHFWQQILRYHHRTLALDNVRLVKLAMVDGFALDQTAVKDSWHHYLGDFCMVIQDSSSVFTILTLHLL
ncbi:TPA: hypothetical protein ACH3X1_004950 [Trebouxia sp. C0004]